MNFITGLPKTTKHHDGIWVLVDILTKAAHFLAIRITLTLEKLVDLYVQEIIILHGVPLSIVSYRGTKFTSKLWNGFEASMGTELYLSIAFHHQTDR